MVCACLWSWGIGEWGVGSVKIMMMRSRGNVYLLLDYYRICWRCASLCAFKKRGRPGCGCIQRAGNVVVLVRVLAKGSACGYASVCVNRTYLLSSLSPRGIDVPSMGRSDMCRTFIIFEKKQPLTPRAIASRQARHHTRIVAFVSHWSYLRCSCWWWCPTSCCIRLDQSSVSPSFVLLLPTHRPRSYPGSMSSPGARRRRWLGGGMTAVALVAAVAGLVGGLWPSSPSSRASSSNSPPQDSAQVPPVVQITSTMAQDAPGTLWEGD